MAKRIQRMLHIVKTFQYLLHAIHFVNAFQIRNARKAVLFPCALRIPGRHEPRFGPESR